MANVLIHQTIVEDLKRPEVEAGRAFVQSDIGSVSTSQEVVKAG